MNTEKQDIAQIKREYYEKGVKEGTVNWTGWTQWSREKAIECVNGFIRVFKLLPEDLDIFKSLPAPTASKKPVKDKPPTKPKSKFVLLKNISDTDLEELRYFSYCFVRSSDGSIVACNTLSTLVREYRELLGKGVSEGDLASLVYRADIWDSHLDWHWVPPRGIQHVLNLHAKKLVNAKTLNQPIKVVSKKAGSVVEMSAAQNLEAGGFVRALSEMVIDELRKRFAGGLVDSVHDKGVWTDSAGGLIDGRIGASYRSYGREGMKLRGITMGCSRNPKIAKGEEYRELRVFFMDLSPLTHFTEVRSTTTYNFRISPVWINYEEADSGLAQEHVRWNANILASACVRFMAEGIEPAPDDFLCTGALVDVSYRPG